MTKILFITATRLGDAVLSTTILDYLIKTNPGADITVACGPIVTGLFRAASGVKKIIPLKKQSYARHWIFLARHVMGRRWDIVVDLRNSALSRVLWASRRIIWSAPDKTRHKIEQLRSLLPPDGQSSVPRLWLDDVVTKKAEEIVPAGGPVLAVGPAANAEGKTWPSEYFIELIRRITAADGILPNARVAIIAAPGEEAMASPVLQSIPTDRRIDVIAKGEPLLAGAVLARCVLYVGNDSGLMHMAAAAGIPTFGLFGPSWPHMYHPWGDHCAYVSTPEDYAQLRVLFGPGKIRVSMMRSLTVDMAFEGVLKLWGRMQALNKSGIR